MYIERDCAQFSALLLLTDVILINTFTRITTLIFLHFMCHKFSRELDNKTYNFPTDMFSFYIFDGVKNSMRFVIAA